MEFEYFIQNRCVQASTGLRRAAAIAGEAAYFRARQQHLITNDNHCLFQTLTTSQQSLLPVLPVLRTPQRNQFAPRMLMDSVGGAATMGLSPAIAEVRLGRTTHKRKAQTSGNTGGSKTPKAASAAAASP